MTSIYKYVSFTFNRYGKRVWEAKVPGEPLGMFQTEKEAAIAVDKILIKQGKDPVNILKKKEK